MKINNLIKPIVFYDDPYQNRTILYKENSDKSGIYRWVNLTNGKTYVGSATNIKNRLYQYFSLANIKNELLIYNSNIYRALLESKYKNFRLEILEYTEEDDLTAIEQYYLDLLKPEYNIYKKAGSNKSSKRKLKTINKLKSSEFIYEDLSKSFLDDVLIVINKKTNEITKHPSIHKAAEYLNVSHGSLIYNMNKNRLLKSTYLLIKLIKMEY